MKTNAINVAASLLGSICLSCLFEPTFASQLGSSLQRIFRAYSTFFDFPHCTKALLLDLFQNPDLSSKGSIHKSGELNGWSGAAPGVEICDVVQQGHTDHLCRGTTGGALESPAPPGGNVEIWLLSSFILWESPENATTTLLNPLV